MLPAPAGASSSVRIAWPMPAGTSSRSGRRRTWRASFRSWTPTALTCSRCGRPPRRPLGASALGFGPSVGRPATQSPHRWSAENAAVRPGEAHPRHGGAQPPVLRLTGQVAGTSRLNRLTPAMLGLTSRTHAVHPRRRGQGELPGPGELSKGCRCVFRPSLQFSFFWELDDLEPGASTGSTVTPVVRG